MFAGAASAVGWLLGVFFGWCCVLSVVRRVVWFRLWGGCWGFSLGGAASCRWSVVLAVADGETVGEPPSGRAHPNELPAQPRVVYEIERVPTPPLAKPRPMRLPRHEAAGTSVRHPTSFRICNRVRHDRSAAPAGMSVRHPTSFRRSLAPCVPASSLTCPQPRRAPPRHRSPPPAPSVRPPARRRREDRFVLGVRPFASPPRHQPVAQHRSDRSISLPSLFRSLHPQPTLHPRRSNHYYQLWAECFVCRGRGARAEQLSVASSWCRPARSGRHVGSVLNELPAKSLPLHPALSAACGAAPQ